MEDLSTPLSKALRAARPALGSAFVISVFINLTLFVAPLYSIQIYDRVLSSRNLGTLLLLTLITGAFVALYGLLEYVRSGILVRGSVRFNEVLAAPLFQVALRAKLAGRESKASQALKDGDTMRDCLASGTISSLFDTPWTLVFVVLCYLLHPALGAVAFLGAVLILVCALFMELATRRGVLEATKAAGEASRFAHAVLRNCEAVRGLGMDAAALAHWNVRQWGMIGAQARSGEQSAAFVALSKSVRMAVQVGLMCIGAWLAIDRLISPGVMIAAMIIMARALAPVEHAVVNWKRVVAFRTAQKRLQELFRALPEGRTATDLPDARGDIQVEALVLISPTGGAPILQGVNFEIAAGEALAIIGPSGSGKSSLARALAGIWTPAKGSVRLDGAALAQWKPDRLGGSIGFLPQDIEFLPGSVAENIARLGEPDDKAVIAAAQAAMVHETILRLPLGYETPVGDGGIALSGGQRQRLALARALYGDPRLIIMDEPNASLDSEGEAALSRALARMKQQKQTVVIITHKPHLLRYVDRVLVLGGGTVKAFGTRDDVLSKLAGPKVTSLPTHGVAPRNIGTATTNVIAAAGA
jgi:ATP-binding cassette subfamily C protein/ATP-binding cassette subfamily C protein EexD